VQTARECFSADIYPAEQAASLAKQMMLKKRG